MTIPKHLIVARLRERGQSARADWVDRELPEEIDTFQHSGLLATLNLRVEDLVPDTSS
jgi:hypothetical protein